MTGKYRNCLHHRITRDNFIVMFLLYGVTYIHGQSVNTESTEVSTTPPFSIIEMPSSEEIKRVLSYYSNKFSCNPNDAGCSVNLVCTSATCNLSMMRENDSAANWQLAFIITLVLLLLGIVVSAVVITVLGLKLRSEQRKSKMVDSTARTNNEFDSLENNNDGVKTKGNTSTEETTRNGAIPEVIYVNIHGEVKQRTPKVEKHPEISNESEARHEDEVSLADGIPMRPPKKEDNSQKPRLNTPLNSLKGLSMDKNVPSSGTDMEHDAKRDKITGYQPEEEPRESGVYEDVLP